MKPRDPAVTPPRARKPYEKPQLIKLEPRSDPKDQPPAAPFRTGSFGRPPTAMAAMDRTRH